MSLLAKKAELNLTLSGKPLKIYPQVKFLGIIFGSKLTFQKHFEDVLERCNHRYHRLQLLANKKWGPSPATLIQTYKQCVRPIFEYGSLSTITASDNIISKIQRLQNKFIRLALRLPKYIIPRLLHDSTGLPYVKDRLLTCATKSLDRIAQNPPSRGINLVSQAQSWLGPFSNATLGGPSWRFLVSPWSSFYPHPSTNTTNLSMLAIITAFGEADMTAAM